MRGLFQEGVGGKQRGRSLACLRSGGGIAEELFWFAVWSGKPALGQLKGRGG